MNENNNARIHPKKFTLYVAIASIMMMFFGFTSAYIVGKNTGKWVPFDLPKIFYFSTFIIIASSFTMYLAQRYFKLKNRTNYRLFLIATLVLGTLFIATQILGFKQLFDTGFGMAIKSSAFLYVIVGVHAVHVLGGMIALIVMLQMALSTKTRNYSNISIELMSIYWHFVDILWIYLLVFLFMLQ